MNIFGQHEIHVFECEEADLGKNFRTCKKNPGHTGFISVAEFKVDHLPEGHRDQDLYDLIKHTADLIVRISVGFVSPRRPDVWFSSDTPYPFHERRGMTCKRSGSGRMTVLKYENGCGFDVRGSTQNPLQVKYATGYNTCPCSKCQHKADPSTVWWEIIVLTATHVVFDEIEADHTSCRLFYDTENSPLEKLDKVSLHFLDIETDKCELKYVTCREEVGGRLFKIALERLNLCKKVWDKYRGRTNMNLNFIVSHPHGCAKHISLGILESNEKVSEPHNGVVLTKLTYTTCTCPGSSGAPVYCLCFESNTHLHCGSLDNGLNHSGVGFYKT